MIQGISNCGKSIQDTGGLDGVRDLRWETAKTELVDAFRLGWRGIRISALEENSSDEISMWSGTWYPSRSWLTKKPCRLSTASSSMIAASASTPIIIAPII